MGRNRLLNYLADRVAFEGIESTESRDRDMPELFAAKAARSDGKCPNPLIVLGSLRLTRDLRRLFVDSIGRVPDIGIVIGGSPGGRAEEEVQLAAPAGIPLLPLPLTGGVAATTAVTCHTSLLE
jgi:hypothetical protein